MRRNLLSRDERELKVNNYHRWGLLKKTEAIIKQQRLSLDFDYDLNDEIYVKNKNKFLINS